MESPVYQGISIEKQEQMFFFNHILNLLLLCHSEFFSHVILSPSSINLLRMNSAKNPTVPHRDSWSSFPLGKDSFRMTQNRRFRFII